jgi:hypothetical protein
LTEHRAKPLGLPTISLPSFRFGRYNGAAEGENEDETDSFAWGSVLVGDGEGFGSNAQVLGSTLNFPLPNSVLSQFLLSAIVWQEPHHPQNWGDAAKFGASGML